MLPKSRRLTSSEVTEVLKRGRSRRGEYLSLKLLILPSPLRASAVVSKSVAKKAVERNRLRRAVYRALSSPLAASVQSQCKGNAVIFVQKVPPGELSRPLLADIRKLFTV
jgi:ribonuclease P protein component